MKRENYLLYNVGTLREAGLEARWGKLRTGAPVLFARNPSSELQHQRETWWIITSEVWDAMNQLGVKEGFDRWTRLGDIFSIKGVDSSCFIEKGGSE